MSVSGTEPKVTVVIPCYERPELLRRALVSVLTQTEQDIEVIVGDDGSSADLAAVVADLADQRVRVARRQVNGGIGAGRNVALAEARGRFVSYLDSDDEWLPHHLEVQLRGFEELPDEVGAVTTGFEMRYPDGRTDRRIPRRHADLTARTVRGVDLSAGSTMMLRADASRRAGPWPEDVPRNEDYDWFLQAAGRGLRLEVLDDVTVVIHSNDRAPLDREALSRSHATILDRHGQDLAARGGGLRRQLRAKLHEEQAWAAWRAGSRGSCALHVGAAVALDPVFRLRKLGRSAVRRARHRAGG